MAVTEGKIHVGGTLEDLDTTVVTQTDGGPAHREAVFVADPETLAARQKVTNAAPTNTDYGAVTRPLGASAANRISTTSFNSRDAATLGAGATFQGVGEDVSGYGRVGVAFTSTSASDGTLTMEVSHDNVTWGGPTRDVSDTRFAQPVMWNIVEKYFRIKYVNGNTIANGLSIQVQYSNNADILLQHQLDEELKDEYGAVLIRGVLAGRQVDGTYENVRVSGDGKLQVDGDSFTHLLGDLLSEQRRTNQLLQYIAGYPLLDRAQEK